MISDHKLDKSVPIPLYYQLKTIIQEEIDAGNYSPDDMIPTEEELINMFGISRTTVRQAISDLVQEGKLYRIKSKGTFVSHSKINQDFIVRLEPFNDQIKHQNKAPKTEVIAMEVITAPPQVISALHLDAGEKAIYLHRKRFADSCPIVVVQTYLPYNRCSFVLNHNFTVESLYNTLEKQDPSYKIRYVKRMIEAAKASAANAKLLEIKSGDPVLVFTSTGYNQADIPLEYSTAYYRADCNKFEITVMA